MRIAGTLGLSLINGDGCRFVVFTQGCHHNCIGCQNPDTHDPNGGYEISVDDLVKQIKKHPFIDGLTLSGGDPFYQQDECVELVKKVQPMNVWAYTGFTYEDIKDTELAKLCDVIVDGEFKIDQKVEGQLFGSSNQRIIRKGKEV